MQVKGKFKSDQIGSKEETDEDSITIGIDEYER